MNALNPQRLMILAAAVAAFGLTACGSSSKQNDPAPSETATRVLPTTLEEAITGTTYRSPDNLKRDQYRHPLDTLNFFGIKPEMTVVEIIPGGGWYMEILAPYLAAKGQYVGAQPAPPPGMDYMVEMVKKTSAWLKDRPEVASNATLVDFAPPIAIVPDETADMVLTFRNVHNWIANKNEAAAFKAFFKALKPGGTLGVVEHRANPKMNRDPLAKSGYVLEKDVIKMAEQAGFKLVAKSEVNANPKDTKDYKEGVWTLPPTLRLKDVDKQKYLDIGESDRMTLKFMKPLAKAAKKSKKN